MTRLIDADALMAQFPCTCGCKNCGQMKDGILPCDIKDKIKEAPTIDRPHGEWEIDSEYGRIYHLFCSECKKDVEDYISGTENWWLNSVPNFCPNCGARMEYNTKDVPDPVSNLIYHPEYEFHKCTDCQKYHNGTCNRIDENNEACGLWKECNKNGDKD